MNSSTSSLDSVYQIGNLLSGSWELTQKIFENLSYREVSRLRCVCRIWADVGSKILEKRRKIHYLTIHPHSIPTTEGKVALGEASPRCLFEGFFEHIVSKPRYCIAFCSEDWLSKPDVFNIKEKDENLTLLQYISGSLPSSCELGLVSATGVIGTVENNYQGHWLESASSMNQEILSYLYGKEKEKRKPNKWSKRHDNTEKMECQKKEEISPNVPSPNTSSQNISSQNISSTSTSSQNIPTNTSSQNILSNSSLPTISSPNMSPENTSQNEGVSLGSSCSSSSDATNTVVTTGEPVKRSSVGYSIEVEQNSTSLRQADAVSVLLIPHHPGVQLKFFRICDEKFFKDFRKDEDACCENLTITADELNHLTSMSHDDQLKALLIFDAGLEEGFTEAIIQSALLRQNHKLALGGGVADSVYTGKNASFSQSSFGIAVCGPNVMAASVVIPKYINNPKGLVEFMKELKSCGLPEDQSVAFMFSCCGRGYSWYRRRGNPWFDYHNVETKAFRQFFPNTPIFGFFGGGEIGLNHFPKFCEREKEDEGVPHKKRKKKMFHQFSTIIVLISFL
nr:uncharacterized protein LOC123766892 [Procambarus clarkii]